MADPVTVVFATNNPNKLREIRELTDEQINILSLADINCEEELPETHETLRENALEKASHVFDRYQVNCFAEDTGLEIRALKGEPGVYSARYAGLQKNAEDNIALVLEKMKNIRDRRAQFRTVIALIMDGKDYFFEGIVEGRIADQPRGNTGFGYDPIFMPENHRRTFAEMSLAEKNSMSHRARAIDGLIKKFSSLDQVK